MGFILGRNVVLVKLFITLTMAVQESDSATPNDIPQLSKWTVHVANKMETGGALFLHCKSKNNDLGIHNLTYDQEFVFRFRVNFWKTTLFWCYFRSSLGHAAFDVFSTVTKGTWFENHCNHGECIWLAKDDGFYLRNIPDHVDDHRQDWNNTSLREDNGFLSK